MALVKCSDCGRSVSSNAVSCPACGNPLSGGGSSGASAFEKRIEEYKAKGYQVKKRSDNSIEMKKHTKAYMYLGIIGFILLSALVFWTAWESAGEKTQSWLLWIFVIPYFIGGLFDGKVIITLTKTGKIDETGNVLEKK